MRGDWRLTKLRGLDVLFVMATEQEYGRELQKRIQPLITGVGPVEAAAVTGATLAALRAKEEMPGLVFSLGSAGSRSLEHAEVYQLRASAIAIWIARRSASKRASCRS